MITVKELKPGTFEPISGNPVLTSTDGETKAPLRTILSPSWSSADRARFGIYTAEPFAVPEGKRTTGAPRYERQGSAVVEVRTVEDIPADPPDTRTPQEKVEAMTSRFGLTLDELRAVLAGGVKQ